MVLSRRNGEEGRHSRDLAPDGHPLLLEFDMPPLARDFVNYEWPVPWC